MRKLILMAAFACLTTISANAQDVLNEIVKTSLATTNDTTLSLEVRKVAVFKYDAMSYLRSKVMTAKDVLSDSVNLDTLNANIKMLNEQAYAMNVYITLYQKRLREAKKKNINIVKSLFKQASFDNKLFNDKDTELVLAYYQRDDYPIQFCLDCDWVKALNYIRTINWSKL